MSGLIRVAGQRLRLRLLASIRQSASYSRTNMKLFALFEIVGQPLYYLMWHVVYPQPYESIPLRAICIALSLPMLFEDRLPYRWAERAITAYWIVFVVFELPFFFVFMSLMNGFSPMWALSTMSAVMIMVILVYDWLMSLLLALAGAALAALVYELCGGDWTHFDMPIGMLISIYLFGLSAGSAFNYKTELVAREKLGAITDAVGTMAHELRTPLLGIRSGARGLRSYVPSLMASYRIATEHGLDVPRIRKAHLDQIGAVLGRIESETEYTGVVLDMLLLNSNRTAIDTRAFETVDIKRCVEDALARYPFHSAAERDRVRCRLDAGFNFRGSHVLMVHVLFNLLKNALYQIARVEQGEIRIWTESTHANDNTLHFRDTGPGIPPAVLPRIFDRFYSGMPRGQGTGIGLAFVKLVIDSFQGDIRCHSVEGSHAEFVITLPNDVTHEPA